ncbi:MAG: purine-nucleoside phosphorylase, partial [Lachnospiraceae bacterium]|nr:purine-nucleoside phosphorylase [Lachnospiraceae bacterium]
MSLDLTRIPTPHIEAKKEDLADVVIMPGDPQRSKFIAEEYLSMPTLVNDIRGIQGYTGLYQGKRVTVMASGIGIPSISLYAYELYNFYDIDTIIRVGTAGSIDPRMRIGDLLFANTAYTDSDFIKHFRLPEGYVPHPDEALLNKAIDIALHRNVRFFNGNVLTEEIYYAQEDEDIIERWYNEGVGAFEMEAAA